MLNKELYIHFPTNFPDKGQSLNWIEGPHAKVKQLITQYILQLQLTFPCDASAIEEARGARSRGIANNNQSLKRVTS